MLHRARTVAFWRFVAERHEVFRRRVLLRQPPPWTTDPVLRRVFFTNIYRELDRATRHLILALQAEPPLHPLDKLFNVIVYRFFALPATYQALGGAMPYTHWNTARALATLRDRQQRGERVFTGAFNISNHGDVRPKIEVVLEQIQWAHDHAPRLLTELQRAATLEAAHHVLQQVPGFAGFMAYEVLIDLCYPEVSVLAHSLDSWVYVGPGALRGLQTLTHAPLTRRHALPLVTQLRDGQHHLLAEEGIALHGPALTLEAVEQALCEWAKYCKAQADGGHVKRKYDDRIAGEEDVGSLWQPLPVRFTDPNYWVTRPVVRTAMTRR